MDNAKRTNGEKYCTVNHTQHHTVIYGGVNSGDSDGLSECFWVTEYLKKLFMQYSKKFNLKNTFWDNLEKFGKFQNLNAIKTVFYSCQQ